MHSAALKLYHSDGHFIEKILKFCFTWWLRVMKYPMCLYLKHTMISGVLQLWWGLRVRTWLVQQLKVTAHSDKYLLRKI
jgi:hypothetical protein